MGNFVLQIGPCSSLILRISLWGIPSVLLLSSSLSWRSSFFFHPAAHLFLPAISLPQHRQHTGGAGMRGRAERVAAGAGVDAALGGARAGRWGGGGARAATAAGARRGRLGAQAGGARAGGAGGERWGEQLAGAGAARAQARASPRQSGARARQAWARARPGRRRRLGLGAIQVLAARSGAQRWSSSTGLVRCTGAGLGVGEWCGIRRWSDGVSGTWAVRAGAVRQEK
jgi:hypothetical protein